MQWLVYGAEGIMTIWTQSVRNDIYAVWARPPFNTEVPSCFHMHALSGYVLAPIWGTLWLLLACTGRTAMGRQGQDCNGQEPQLYRQDGNYVCIPTLFPSRSLYIYISILHASNGPNYSRHAGPRQEAAGVVEMLWIAAGYCPSAGVRVRSCLSLYHRRGPRAAVRCCASV